MSCESPNRDAQRWVSWRPRSSPAPVLQPEASTSAVATLRTFGRRPLSAARRVPAVDDVVDLLLCAHAGLADRTTEALEECGAACLVHLEQPHVAVALPELDRSQLAQPLAVALEPFRHGQLQHSRCAVTERRLAHVPAAPAAQRLAGLQGPRAFDVGHEVRQRHHPRCAHPAERIRLPLHLVRKLDLRHTGAVCRAPPASGWLIAPDAVSDRRLARQFVATRAPVCSDSRART